MLIRLAPEDNIAVATTVLAAGTKLDDAGLVSRD